PALEPGGGNTRIVPGQNAPVSQNAGEGARAVPAGRGQGLLAQDGQAPETLPSAHHVYVVADRKVAKSSGPLIGLAAAEEALGADRLEGPRGFGISAGIRDQQLALSRHDEATESLGDERFFVPDRHDDGDHKRESTARASQRSAASQSSIDRGAESGRFGDVR